MRSIFLIAFLLGICQIVYAQEDHKHQHSEHQEDDHEEHEEHYRHMVSLFLGHAIVSKGFKNENRSSLVLASWALDYNYFIDPKWALGLHTDIIIDDFEVESKSEDDDVAIIRSNPISFVGAVSYKPLHYLAIILGAGVEHTPDQTFTVIRMGVEPSIPISNKYEVVFNVVYDIKIDAYNHWTLGVGIARLF